MGGGLEGPRNKDVSPPETEPGGCNAAEGEGLLTCVLKPATDDDDSPRWPRTGGICVDAVWNGVGADHPGGAYMEDEGGGGGCCEVKCAQVS